MKVTGLRQGNIPILRSRLQPPSISLKTALHRSNYQSTVIFNLRNCSQEQIAVPPHEKCERILHNQYKEKVFHGDELSRRWLHHFWGAALGAVQSHFSAAREIFRCGPLGCLPVLLRG